jgi:hypothetical protein
VNVDARKFDFMDVEWGPNVKRAGTRLDLHLELDALKDKKISPRHRLLSITCRQLALNAEENHRYEEASRFRYLSMEARRKEVWRGQAFWRLYWWYWMASGYGERVWRAFVCLFAIWVIFAALYTKVWFTKPEDPTAVPTAIDVVGEPLGLKRALAYSLGVMSLQRPDPKPLTDAAEALVRLEAVLGPLQSALLALAIRRKFMR